MKVTILCALVLMALFFIMLWAAVALVQSKKLFTSAPKDIQAAIGEHTERFPGARILGWGILVLDMVIFLCVLTYAGWDGIRSSFGFWQFFGRFLTMLYLLKAFDIVGFDWLLLTKSHFFQHYYPETEGCAGYHQFGFNRREQLTKIILFPFVALLLAWICVLL